MLRSSVGSHMEDCAQWRCPKILAEDATDAEKECKGELKALAGIENW